MATSTAQLTKRYKIYSDAFSGQRKPCAFIDMDILAENAKAILKRANGRPVRIASKSVRCKSILRFLIDFDPQFKGIMCYSPYEACWLSDEGFDDLIVAYPTTDKAAIEQVAIRVNKGKQIYLMVDRSEHVLLISEVGLKLKLSVPIWIDLDLSISYPGIWFGVQRSSIRNNRDLQKLLELIKSAKGVKLTGLMGYEAQIAGLGDRVPGKGILNPIIRLLKKNAIPKIKARRQKAVELIKSFDFELKQINGGGTGSIETTIKEEVVTEVSAGSGFYASGLFDHYDSFQHLPAAGFVLEVNRMPQSGIITCQNGGYIASGPFGIDKQPIPYLPPGISLLDNEMAGEVQTPLKAKPGSLQIGDAVFFRHAKAGELLERFDQIHLIENGKIGSQTPSYRGEGKNFG